MPNTTDATASTSPPKPPPSRKAWLAWATVCLVWGTTYLAIRVAIETIPPFLMTGTRWVAAGLLLAAVLKLQHQPLPDRSSWMAHAILGALLIGFGNGAVVWAEQIVPSGLAALLVAVTPFWMIGIQRVMSRTDPLARHHIVGLVVGFAGVALLVGPEIKAGGGGAFLAGVIATQLAAFGWSLGSNYARRRRESENVLAASALQMVFGGFWMLGMSVLTRESWTIAFSARSVLAAGYLLVFGSIVGFSAYAYALKHLPLSTVSLYSYINPVIAVLLGALVLDEPLSGRTLIAGAIVLTSVVIVRK